MRRTIVLALALAAGVLLAASCGGGEEAEPTTIAPGVETETAPPATEPAPPATTGAPLQPSVEASAVTVYFLREDKIGTARRTIVETPAVATAALEELLGGPTAAEKAAGLHTEIPPATQLRALSIADGIATVDLSGKFDDGGGSLTMFARLAQVVYTLTQFPSVEGVVFELEGKPVQVFSSEGIALNKPQTRADYEDVTPAIFVETPAVGDTVSSPMRLTGTANVFEATFNYELLDATGQVIADDFVTATCGTGCRGTFDVTVPFEWTGEPEGTLVVFELSAKDGSRINVVEIPLTFE